jgi:hypothetical protein
MLRKAPRSAGAIVLLTWLMGASGSAQTYDKRTVFTFSGPVALPGVTLPAGQYVFRLADPASSRKVVQVLSADGKTAYGMFLSSPAERLEPASTPEVQFIETASSIKNAGSLESWSPRRTRDRVGSGLSGRPGCPHAGSRSSPG